MSFRFAFRFAILCATALSSLPLPGHAQSLSFDPVPFAGEDAAKRQVIASTGVSIDGTPYPLAYTLLARSGDKIGDVTFGLLVDQEGKPVMDAKGKPDVSDDPDFTSLLRHGDKLYSITHFESRPGAMYLSEVAQDKTGKLSLTSSQPIDFSGVHGLWVPCAGSVTPWGTHMGGEEYPPDAEALENARDLSEVSKYNLPMARYFGLDPATMTLDQFRAVFPPYAYGFPTEISIEETGKATAVKHYAMGRMALELAYVMPDRKTAYITDDGTNVGLYKFVADSPGNLDAGQLYALKWTQTSDQDAGAADVTWVDLGHADSAAIAAFIDKGLKFSDIFDSQPPGADGRCAEGFGASIAADVHECLKVKDGMDMAASRLETRRYASLKGATTEFRKMEGMTFNPDQNVAYLAMSEISKGMEDASDQDTAGPNQIRLGKNKCGAVYELDMDARYNVTRMQTLLAGKPLSKETLAKAADPSCDPAHSLCGASAEVNSCYINGIANPDNLTFIPGYDTLIIGEDTGDGHQNDVIWAYNLGEKKLTRIFSTPYGSETTSPYWYPDVNGHGYLMAVVQHPYGESDKDKLTTPTEARAYIGYIGPFPAMATKTK